VVEHFIGNEEVDSSILSSSTTHIPRLNPWRRIPEPFRVIADTHAGWLPRFHFENTIAIVEHERPLIQQSQTRNFETPVKLKQGLPQR
jgi:hypothetical protein